MLPNFNHPTPRCWEHSAKRTSTAISPYCCVVFQMRSATLDLGTMCCKNPRCSQSNLDLFSHLREHLDKIEGPGFNHWVPNQKTTVQNDHFKAWALEMSFRLLAGLLRTVIPMAMLPACWTCELKVLGCWTQNGWGWPPMRQNIDHEWSWIMIYECCIHDQTISFGWELACSEMYIGLHRCKCI